MARAEEACDVGSEDCMVAEIGVSYIELPIPVIHSGRGAFINRSISPVCMHKLRRFLHQSEPTESTVSGGHLKIMLYSTVMNCLL